jgi:outer membrane protein assembly factor BamE
MLPRHFRLSAGSALCVALAVILGGCASKNPLMEEPAPMASRVKPAPAPEAQAASNNAVAQPEAPKAAATTAETATAPAAEQAPAAPVAAATPDAATAAPTAEPQAPAAEKAAEAPAATASTAASSQPAGVHVEHKKRFLGIFSPYRPDIQQGNFVSQEMVAQLKVGMTPDQVVFLLGTPLLNDIFHGERWDYPFRMQKGNGEITTSRVTVYFENNRVSRIEGGELPTEADYLARIANKAKQKK